MSLQFPCFSIYDDEVQESLYGHESGTRYSKEFAAFLKETYGHIPDDLPYA